LSRATAPTATAVPAPAARVAEAALAHAAPRRGLGAARAESVAGLYVHVPFCAVRCTYCDFSTGSLSEAGVQRYLGALEREIDRRAPAASGTRFHSVFFGGGTPSTLVPRAFDRLWGALRNAFDLAPDAEVTLEANPESVRDDRLEAWAKAGLNRLSFGAQSFDPAELTLLGRAHDAERPAHAVGRARAHGFERWSLDLMFGFPSHTPDRWDRTLERTLALDPEHVSAYCFIPEPGTPLGDDVAAGRAVLPDDEAQAALYARLESRLGQAGYACYETSNFCRPGAEARHNMVYWLRRPYLGLGPSAHGFLGGRRYGNHYDRDLWAGSLERGETPEAEAEHETPESQAREIVMLGLRLACGLHAADYPVPVWKSVEARYGEAFRRGLEQGRLERCSEGVRIPAAHRFVADDVIAWVDAAAGV
jgi:oxygen-independent coproporphyrinogen-3 oxidase